MAITFIYPIKVTGGSSLAYDTNDKVAKVENTKNDSQDSLNYILRDKKGNRYNLSEDYLKKMEKYITRDEAGNITFHTIKSSLNCSVENAYKEWEQVRRNAKSLKTKNGNLQYCIVQNFGTDLNPELANQIGLEFASKYLSDYQCVISTHINTGHVHNHIEFNATSFITNRKYNDDYKAIDDIRKVSDELCKKYELEVLEKTKDFKFIVYKDAEGKTKIYEPTERKNEGYTFPFADFEYGETHVEILKKDIERFVPYASNFEELLEQLRNVNYKINDKTKTGEWKKYICYKAPGWEKYVRDCRLGEEYSRENLIKRIEKEKQKNTNRNSIGEYLRGDTDALNKELDEIKKQAMYIPHERTQIAADGNKRKQYLLDRINANLKTIKFVEEKDIKSLQQINVAVKTLYEKRKNCTKQLNQISEALKRASADIVLIKKYNNLKETIATNKSEEYIIYEKQNDMELLKNYEFVLKNKDLLNAEKQKIFKENFEKYNSIYKELAKSLEKVNRNIKAYDDCIYNISRADKDNGNRYEEQIKEYYEGRE